MRWKVYNTSTTHFSIFATVTNPSLNVVTRLQICLKLAEEGIVNKLISQSMRKVRLRSLLHMWSPNVPNLNFDFIQMNVNFLISSQF